MNSEGVSCATVILRPVNLHQMDTVFAKEESQNMIGFTGQEMVFGKVQQIWWSDRIPSR